MSQQYPEQVSAENLPAPVTTEDLPAQPSPPSLPAQVTQTPAMMMPGRAGAPVAQGLQMKERNPVAAWIGLPLITLGIYFYVWYYKIHKEMAMFDRRRVVPVAGPMLVMLFLGWLVIPAWISFYNTGKRIATAQRAAGMPASCNPLVGLLLSFVFGLGVLYYQSELNKITDSYQHAPEGTQVPLYV
jgi:hypothetical protein